MLVQGQVPSELYLSLYKFYLSQKIGRSLCQAYTETHVSHLPLDVLQVEIFLLAWHVVRAHDSGLLARLDGAGEDAAESVETPFVAGGHHLGHVHHEGCFWVTVLDTCKEGGKKHNLNTFKSIIALCPTFFF